VKPRVPLLFWICAAAALVVSFSYFPKLALLPIVPLAALAILARFIFARRTGTASEVERSENRARFRKLFIGSAVVVVLDFAWLVYVLRFFRDDADKLFYFAILPFAVLLLTGATLFGAGIYYVRK